MAKRIDLPELYRTVKQRHVASARTNARAVLESINAEVGQDFHTLRSSQVDKLLEEADRVKYRKPKNANGSRGSYFYAKLQREASRKS